MKWLLLVALIINLLAIIWLCYPVYHETQPQPIIVPASNDETLYQQFRSVF